MGKDEKLSCYTAMHYHKSTKLLCIENNLTKCTHVVI